MTESDSRRHKSVGSDLPSSAYRLGIDTAGREHYHDPMTQHIWVARDSDVVHERDLDGRSVVAWVLFVDEKLAGWAERHPVEEAGGLESIVEDVARRLDA
ncbi:hypothetical protein ACFR97_10350 [Haloplanus litoreus]|uniref:Uncharacterized protein n=1 Tax=Haloplanus litoreus TaxID=767515 RepID=A0ABD6A3I8_9EURY